MKMVEILPIAKYTPDEKIGGHVSVVKVFLVCSGLGHISRGYESFTQECFEALRDERDLDLTLFKGGGIPNEKQKPLWNLPRNSHLGTWLGKKIGKNGYWVEQVTFTISLLPHVMRRKPDVIYFSDCNIGNLLWHWRRLTKQNYKLLLSNGGPFAPPFPRWDHVHQVAPLHLEAASLAGQTDETQRLLPYGIRTEMEMPPLESKERIRLRQELKLPLNQSVVLSVGAVNSGHKRMDYVIREIAALPVPRPYFVMLGQQDEETPEIKILADKMLGANGYQIKTVPHQEVPSYYQAVDAFVLASLTEGFGRVFLEAMSWGLPCLAHDYALTRYVLGDAGYLSDFEQIGNLTNQLRHVLSKKYNAPARLMRHQAVFDRFSWQILRKQYVQMLIDCASLSSPAAHRQ